ncbi:hypothetical protein Q5O24_06215 [Eubacteriaceae bacterium ES3]|nr:hypothetical protein Q5O24_06215 [Eubacteriaceae bacterium ES3]
MNFEFGMKGYSFGLIAIICWAVNLVLGFITSSFDLGAISSILSFGLGIAVLVFGVLAFVNGKKELEADPDNKKAKTGKIIGLVIIILEIVSIIFVLLIGGLAIWGLSTLI